MGSWNATINGNDTAQDLKLEYQAAFFYNDTETALAKIDAYVRSIFDETDEEEWCNYYYSLADYMWKHGILTGPVRERAVAMIDAGFGLELWADAGTKTLEKRRKALADFRSKLLSPQPPKKKIRLDLYLTPIYEAGDVVAIQLQTADKHYIAKSRFSEPFFRDCDGKYLVLRKVTDLISYTSVIEPRVNDYWAVFQLYGKVFDRIPTAEELESTPWADPIKRRRSSPYVSRDLPVSGLFFCESSMYYFRKRKYRIIGKDLRNFPPIPEGPNDIPGLFLGINHIAGNSDTNFLHAILDGDACQEDIRTGEV